MSLNHIVAPAEGAELPGVFQSLDVKEDAVIEGNLTVSGTLVAGGLVSQLYYFGSSFASGGDLNRYARPRGTATSTTTPGGSVISLELVGAPGTITKAAVYTLGADNTTVFTLSVNDELSYPIRMTDFASVVPLNAPVQVGDFIGVQWSGGTMPANTAITLFSS